MSSSEKDIHKIHPDEIDRWVELIETPDLETRMVLGNTLVYLLADNKEIPLTFSNILKIKSQIWAGEEVRIQSNFAHLVTTEVEPINDYHTFKIPTSQMAIGQLRTHFEARLAQTVEQKGTDWKVMVVFEGDPTSDSLKKLKEVILESLLNYLDLIGDIKFAVVVPAKGPSRTVLNVIGRPFLHTMKTNQIEARYFTDDELKEAEAWLLD